MKIFINNFLVMCFCLLMFISCKKEKQVQIAPLKFDQSSLPIIADNGQNYYGFLLDGVPVWGQNHGSPQQMVSCRYLEEDASFNIYLNGERGASLSIDITAVLKAGETYILKEREDFTGSKASAIYYEVESEVSQMVTLVGYVSNNDEPGYIKILKLDRQKKTVSGIFELKVRQQWRTRTMNITKGRFDVTYTPYRSIIL